MKKQLIIGALALATSLSAFGQGYVLFQTTKASGVWYGPGANGNVNGILGNNQITVGFLWANAGAPQVGSTGTPTNAAVIPSWDSLLNDSAFHFATNSTSGSLATVAVNNSGVGQGGFSYNGGVAFPVLGTTGGSTIQVFVIGWSSAYANPWLAAANSSFVGFSKPFSYATTPDSGQTTTFAGAGMTAFGVQAIPEPATFALAGLGAAAMLVFRRRK